MHFCYKTENGTEVSFKCDLEDRVFAHYEGKIISGEVIALDDDGYVTLGYKGKEVRVHNTDIATETEALDEMVKRIKAIHQECEEFVGEADTAKSSHDVVGDVADLDVDFEAFDGLKDYVERAVYLANLWRDDLTLKGYAEESEILIEELCGFLAEKLS